MRAHRTPSRPSPPAGPGREGFTLIELLLVLVLIGTLTSLALPRLRADSIRIDAATHELRGHLHAARSAAILRGHPIRIRFDTQGGWIERHEDLDGDGLDRGGERTVRHPLGHGAVFGRGAAPPLRGASPREGRPVTFRADAAGLPTLTFRRDGASDEEGVIYLTVKGNDRGRAGASASRALEVNRATGIARCFRLDGKEWNEGC